MATLNQGIESLKTSLGVDLVLCYATSDRNPPQIFNTVVATDTLAYFKKILAESGPKDKIALAVMTNGGQLEAPWPIVSLVREYCNELTFVVIEKALSAGTLMALGADKIVMTPWSHISPIDPNRSKHENGTITQIEVEDVIGYMDLMRDRVGTDSPEAAKSVIDHLSTQISPTDLGSIYRTHALIRMLSEKMLNLHNVRLDSTRIKNVVRNLTEQLFSHNHLISRSEAKNDIGFGDVIVFPEQAQERKINILGEILINIMELDKPFNPALALGTNDEINFESSRAIISDGSQTYMYKTKVKATRNVQDANQPMVNINDLGWVKEDSE